MARSRTQVGIVGAGPAGLLLGQMLHRAGIDSVILERGDRDHVIERVRAGVLEQGTVDLMREIGAGARLDRDGLRHDGLYLCFDEQRHHVDLSALSGGRAITVYGQNDVVRDLIDMRQATGRPIVFEAAAVRVDDIDSTQPVIRYRHGGDDHELACDVVAGCDGFHGVCRQAMPSSILRVYERAYPFAWLGILAQAPPSCPELVYSLHDRGFALFSMRSRAITRLYLQCAPDEDVEAWSDDRIWSELRTRFTCADGWTPNVGPIVQKGVTRMRSFVAEPMQHGRLFLAGDAAHIVPPTGAKGLNLAAADAWRLAGGLETFYRSGREDELRSYSERGLTRAWRAQRFSWWMTSTLHQLDEAGAFDRRRQQADLDHLVHSRAALTAFAEQYAGTTFS